MGGNYRFLSHAFYMWQALRNISATEEEGHQEITRLLGGLYQALAPLEKASAWVEANDGAPAQISIALIDHGAAAVEALERLATFIRRDQEHSKAIMGSAAEKAATNAETPKAPA